MRLEIRLAVALISTVTLVSCTDTETSKQRHYAQGVALAEQKQYASAIIEFRNAIRDDPQFGEAHHRLAQMYEATDDAPRALAEYVRAADLLTDNVEVQLRAGSHLLLAGSFDDARSRADRVLAMQPENAEARALLGNALAGLQDLDAAIIEIEEAIRLDPERGRSYTNLALLQLAQGRRKQAEAAFLKAVETDPQSVPAHLSLANYQWATGDVRSAELNLARAYSLDPYHLLTNRMMAAFYIGDGRLAEAEPHLRTLAEKAASPTTRLVLADYYMLLKRAEDVRRVVRPLSADPIAQAAAESRLAAVEYMEGDKALAHSMIDKLLQRVNDAHAHVFKAQWLRDEGKTEEALVHAQAAVEASRHAQRFPIAAYYLLGTLQVATGRTADAINSFSTAVKINPRASAAQVHLARLHLAQGEPEHAIGPAKEALKGSPGNVEARVSLARAWIARQDEQGVDELTNLLREHPNVAEVHSLDGSRRLQARDLAGAAKAYARALELDSRSIEAVAGLTAIDLIRGDRARARSRIATQLASRPSNAQLLMLAARVDIADKAYRQSEQALRQVIAIDFNAIEAYELLTRIFAAEGRIAAAHKEFSEIVSREPQNVSARIVKAILEDAQGKKAEAKQQYQEILKMAPHAAVAANNLSWTYVEEGENLHLALKLSEAALRELPNSGSVHHTLGWVHARQGSKTWAIRSFEQSVVKDPLSAMYRYDLGRAYAEAKDFERARNQFETTLRLDNRFVAAKRAIERLQN